MPDDSPGENYSVFIKTEAEIKELADELSKNAFDSNVLSGSQLNLASQAWRIYNCYIRSCTILSSTENIYGFRWNW